MSHENSKCDGVPWFYLLSCSSASMVIVKIYPQLLATPWTAAHQASLSLAISWSLLRLMSNELVMPSNHLLSPSSPAFNLSQH